jgi:PAS domain S-box-containing protein
MKYIAASKRYLIDYDLGDQNVIGRSHYDVFPEIPERWKEIHRRCLAGAVEKSDEDPFPRINGDLDWVRWEIRPWFEREGEIGGLILFSEVITESKRAKEQLNNTLQELKFHIENTPLAVIEFNSKYQITKWSDNAAKMFGWQADEVLGKKIDELRWVYKDDVEKVDSLSDDMSVGKTNSNLNINRNYRKDSIVITCEWHNSALLDPEGNMISVYSLVHDITEQKQNEVKLRVALKEKEVLIRELYHRTKNNMQVVYALLGLKSNTVEDEKTKTILEDMGNRIQTIALVHQKLYQSNNLSRIDLKDYITDLANLLMDSFYSPDKNIRLSLYLESISVLIDTAIPCGLVINELISNSFKHAFPDGKSGVISVKLVRHEKDIIELRVWDNGIGIPEGKDIMNGDTIGVQVFRNIAEDQLQGEVKYETQNGVSCTILFKDILYEERI